jgi:hypothetical protein
MEDRLQTINKTVLDYYSQLKSKELTEEDFNLWIDSLPEPMKSAFKSKGLNQCRGVLNFQRFILELQDNGLEEYLKNELKEEDYSYWRDQSK